MSKPRVYAFFDLEGAGNGRLYGTPTLSGGTPAAPADLELMAFAVVFIQLDLQEKKAHLLGSYTYVNELFATPRTVEAWRELWTARGFGLNCFEGFWAKQLPALNSLATPPRFISSTPFFHGGVERAPLPELMRAFDKQLGEWEQRYDLQIMFDTPSYDASVLNAALERYGYYALHSTRQGGYRGASDVHSMLVGHCPVALQAYLNGGWKVLRDSRAPYLERGRAAFCKVDLDMFRHEDGTDAAAHTPAYDAFQIALEFCGLAFA